MVISRIKLWRVVVKNLRPWESCVVIVWKSLIYRIYLKKLPDQYIIKRWRRDARDIVVQDATGKVVQKHSKLNITECCKNLCFKLVKLAARASDFEETYLYIDHVADKLHEKIDSYYKLPEDELKTLKENIIESIEQSHSLERVIENVKGLKKKETQKGRKRLRSRVEKQPKRKTNASRSKKGLNKPVKVWNLWTYVFTYLLFKNKYDF